MFCETQPFGLNESYNETMPPLLPDRKDRDQLDALFASFLAAKEDTIGYPPGSHFDNRPIRQFLELSLNNAGDPFGPGTHNRLNTHRFEREVIEHYADTFHAPENFSGYVTGGGSEGNLYGMYLAREKYPRAKIYFSDQSHYSIEKNARLLKIPYATIASSEKGQIDYAALADQLRRDPGSEAIVIANIGTTMLGAIDHVPKILDILDDTGKTDHAIHCDAAFFGIPLSLIDAEICADFDFHQVIDSIACSGHKTSGLPIPCGFVIVRKENADRITKEIEYIGASDNTITGSRSGIAPLLLWYDLRCIAANRAVVKQQFLDCYEKAQNVSSQITALGVESFVNEHSNIVVFEKPSNDIRDRWQLATEGKWSHLMILPHVTDTVLAQFLDEMAETSSTLFVSS